MAPDHFTVI